MSYNKAVYAEMDPRAAAAVRARLEALPERMRKKVGRRAVTKAGRRMTRGVKQTLAAHRQTGTLANSIYSKVNTPNGEPVATVGPAKMSASRFTKGGKRKRASREEIKAKTAVTLNYAHFLEFGHRIVGHGPKGKRKDTGKRVAGKFPFRNTANKDALAALETARADLAAHLSELAAP